MERQKSTQAQLKKDNKMLILSVIRQRHPLSRADISRRTGLTKVTVSSLVDELIQQGFVIEVGSGPSSLGRKPVLISFNATVGYVIGVELGPGRISIICIDLSYNVVREELVMNPPNDTNSFLLFLVEVLRRFIDLIPSSPFGLIGIGVGVLGFVDFSSGVVIKSINLPLDGVNITELLSKIFNVPVLVDNEANAAAWGEILFGSATSAESVAFISVGTGIGVGLIFNRQLYRGVSGLAGEVGHTTIIPDGTQCECGNRGCWEMYGSEKYLYHLCEQFGFDGVKSEVLPWILTKIEQNDPRALQAIRSVGQYLGIGFANIANTFNPELMVLGNRMTAIAPWIMPVIRISMRERCLDPVVERLRLVVSTQGELAVVKGAGALAVEHCLQQRCNA